MASGPTHTVFTVRVAEHEAADADALWRITHASDTIALVYAYFDRDHNGPIRDEDGTFTVHAPSWTTLDTLREMLTKHEGFTIVSESAQEGTGIDIRTTWDV